MLEDQPSRISGSEQALGAPAPDQKKFCDYGQAAGFHPLEGAVGRLHSEISAVLRDHAGALSRALLPVGSIELADWLANSDKHVLRLSWYPPGFPISNYPHTDICLLTLLPPATAPGLEVLLGERWTPAKPPSGRIIALPGELLSYFGGPPPMIHRVVDVRKARISASYFANPPATVVIGTRTVAEIVSERLSEINPHA